MNENPTECKNGGIKSPRSMNKCICPDGVYGKDCSKNYNWMCGETVFLDDSNPSRRIDTYNPLFSRIDAKCDYVIRAPEGRKIRTRAVYGTTLTCSHGSYCPLDWLEIRDSGDFLAESTHLCCNSVLNYDRVSATEEVKVLFRSYRRLDSIKAVFEVELV